MNKANKVKLGAFVLLSIVLLIAGFVAAGITQIFAPKIRAVTVLNTSVEGLAAGSPVKYLGLPVGKVTRIAMREKDGYIAVYFDLSPAAMDSQGAGRVSLSTSASNLVEVLQKHNPSCFINAAGIMGGSYLELTLGGQEPPALPDLQDIPEDAMYIKSRPSHIGNAIQNVSIVLEEIGKVNLVQLTDKLNQALDHMSEVLSSGELTQTLKYLHNITRNLDMSMQNINFILSTQNIDRINHAIASVENTAAKIQQMTGDEEMNSLFKNLNGFLVESRQFLKSVDAMKGELSAEAAALKIRLEESLTRLDNTTRSISRQFDRFEDDPNQIVRGRRPPEIESK
jgi:ABC-type transporter Mla subunit MlaD